MKRPGLLAISAAVVVGIAIVAAAIVLRPPGKSDVYDPNSSQAIIDTFPVPANAVVAFPDTITGGIATKGWRHSGTLAQACSAWREAYRGWIDPGEAGSVTGEEELGRRCTLSGPKSGHLADLSVTVYGDDTTPSVTLSVHK